MNRAELQAWSQSPGGWGEVGGLESHVLYAMPFDRPRNHMRYCWQCKEAGVKRRADHGGFANGVCLTEGCEFHVRQWARGLL